MSSWPISVWRPPRSSHATLDAEAHSTCLQVSTEGVSIFASKLIVLLDTECQGGLDGHRQLGYSTRANDIWSLGVILVNLTCGRNPWRQASAKDETFRAYIHNPDFLRSILPISLELNDLLKRIFALDPDQRLDLPGIMAAVNGIATFTMSEDELRLAHAAAKPSNASTVAAFAHPGNPGQPIRSRPFETAVRGRVSDTGPVNTKATSGSTQHTPQLEHNRTLSSSEDDVRLPQTPPCPPNQMLCRPIKSRPSTPNRSRSPSPLEMHH